ncbi:uroporphyrinogen decarboxylase family protein [Chloroflexota bacterium]
MTSEMETTEKSWQELSSDEKLEKRLQAWLSAPDIEFASAEAEADYKARATRIMDAILLRKEPDRVPVMPSLGGLAAAYCGYTQKDMLYDVDKNIEVATKCTLEFQFDVKISAGGAGMSQGEVGETLDERLYNWPGHGVDDENTFQFNEGEYMKADEYDAFIQDPSDFWWRTYLPRIWGVAEPLGKLMPLAQLNEGSIGRFGLPEVQAALKKLMSAGQKALAWQQKIVAANRKLTELGFPDMRGVGGGQGHGGATFDYLGDGMRGTRGISIDMHRQPDKLLEALDAAAARKIHEIRHNPDYARLGNCPVAGFALHKGADGFMSDEQFKTFYWPTLRRVCLALIDEGFIVSMFAEGGYESRLEVIRDLPKGRAIWHFDRTDMTRAKDVLGDVACIMGNVPVALIHSGTPEDVETCCRQLIDTAGKGGGFILATGAGVDRNGKVENVRAMISCAKQYGVYS